MPKAIRRLGCNRIEDALECLRDCQRAEAIHCARKDIKKVRALLRLARTKIANRDCRRITDLLRKAAGQLAAPRDAHVAVETLRNLARHFKNELRPGALRPVQTALRTARDKEMSRFSRKRCARSVESILRRVTKNLDGLKVRGKGWKVLSSGLEKSYADGQEAYEMIRRAKATPDDLHEWRKRAKDLWYHVILLQPIWPEQMEAFAEELKTLTEQLGEDHDLGALLQVLEEDFSAKNPARLKTLKRLICERQGELRGAALAMGSRFFAEKPSVFCNRLAAYWKIWRCQKRPRVKADRIIS